MGKKVGRKKLNSKKKKSFCNSSPPSSSLHLSESKNFSPLLVILCERRPLVISPTWFSSDILKKKNPRKKSATILEQFFKKKVGEEKGRRHPASQKSFFFLFSFALPFLGKPSFSGDVKTPWRNFQLILWSFFGTGFTLFFFLVAVTLAGKLLLPDSRKLRVLMRSLRNGGDPLTPSSIACSKRSGNPRRIGEES